MLKLQTTTDMTADQIHDLGLSEVSRIRAEMETLKAKIGFEGKLEDFFVFLRSDDRFYVANDDVGRAPISKWRKPISQGCARVCPSNLRGCPKPI
jgi:uncharacterized protein (DUF885 family)